MTQLDLINDLEDRTRQVQKDILPLINWSIDKLNFKPSALGWSALECLEHLSLYSDFYLPEMEKQILKSPTLSASSKNFKPGLLGRKFVKMVGLDGSKMNSPKDKNPSNLDPLASQLTLQGVQRFLNQQERTLNLLDQARKVDLNKVKTGISISQIVRLKLGDTFRVVIHHNQRHVAQALRAGEKG